MKAGEKKGPTHRSLSDSYLDGANNRKLQVDLDGNLKFPRQIAETNPRPDMFLLSENTNKIGLFGLIVLLQARTGPFCQDN